MSVEQSFYDILKVEPSAPLDAVQAAYRRQISLYHPDKVAGLGDDLRALAEERAKEINSAYSTLGNPVTRAAYDRARAAASSPPPSPARDDDYAHPASETRRKNAGANSPSGRRLRADTLFADIKEGGKVTLVGIIVLSMAFAARNRFPELSQRAGAALGGFLAVMIAIVFRSTFFLIAETLSILRYQYRKSFFRKILYVFARMLVWFVCLVILMTFLIMLLFGRWALIADLGTLPAYSYVPALALAACLLPFGVALFLLCLKHRPFVG